MDDDSVDCEMILEMGRRFCWEILARMKPRGKEAAHVRHALFALESYPQEVPNTSIEISLDEKWGDKSDHWSRRGCKAHTLQVYGNRIDLMVGGSDGGDSYTTFSASVGDDEHCHGEPKDFNDIFNETDWDGYELNIHNDNPDEEGDSEKDWPIDYFRRYPDALVKAIQTGSFRVNDILLCLNELNDPLLSVASLALIVRNSLDDGETDYDQVASMFTGKSDNTDCHALDAAWESLGSTAGLIRRFYNDLPTLEGIIDSDCDFGGHFWASAIPRDNFRLIVRSAYLSAIGKFPFGIYDCLVTEVKFMKSADKNHDRIRFLLRREQHAMEWMDVQWSDDQIRSFPELIEHAATIELMGNVEVGEAGDSIEKIDVSRFLCADPGYGLKMICKHYLDANWNDNSLDCFRDALGEIEERLPGELLDQLKGIYHTSTEPDIREGAIMLMEHYCDYVMSPEVSEQDS